jgi:hypothetical protein
MVKRHTRLIIKMVEKTEKRKRGIIMGRKNSKNIIRSEN